MISLQYLFEQKKFKKIHGHDKYRFDRPEAYFHNFATHDVIGSPEQTPGYQHYARLGKTPYHVIHIGSKHGINSEYALGHGPNKDAQWFKFTKKIKDGWWDISSGKKVEGKGK